MSDVKTDLQNRQTKIQGILDEIARGQDAVKELRSDYRYEAKKLNKLIAKYPTEAAEAEVKAIVLKKEAAASTEGGEGGESEGEST